jgi:hypothetical protein
MNRHHARRRFDPVGRIDLDGQAVLVSRPVDTNLIAEEKHGQQAKRSDEFEVHAASLSPSRDPAIPDRFAQRTPQRQTGAASPA